MSMCSIVLPSQLEAWLDAVEHVNLGTDGRGEKVLAVADELLAGKVRMPCRPSDRLSRIPWGRVHGGAGNQGGVCYHECSLTAKTSICTHRAARAW